MVNPTRDTEKNNGLEKRLPVEKKPYNKSFNVLPLAVILLILILFNAWALYKMRQAHLALKNTVDQINNEKIAFLKQIHILQNAKNQTNTKIQNLEQSTKNLLTPNLLNQKILLAKTRFYLDLAKTNAYWSNDQKTTLALLTEANALLQKSTHPKVFSLREAINQDIQAVRMQTLPDITGILSTLDAIKKTLLTLPLKSTLNEEKQKVSEVQSTTPKTWKAQWKQTTEVLKDLIVIQKKTAPLEAYFSPLYLTILKESIGMNIQVAEWALLNREPQIYQSALDRCLKTMERIFDLKAVSTKAVIEQIRTLKKVSLDYTRPEIGKSLELIDEYLNSEEGTS